MTSGRSGSRRSVSGATGPEASTQTSFDPWLESSSSSPDERPVDIRARAPRIVW